MSIRIAPKEQVLKYIAENRHKKISFKELQTNVLKSDDIEFIESSILKATTQYSDVIKRKKGKVLDDRTIGGYLEWIGTEDEAEAVIHSS